MPAHLPVVGAVASSGRWVPRPASGASTNCPCGEDQHHAIEVHQALDVHAATADDDFVGTAAGIGGKGNRPVGIGADRLPTLSA